MFVFGGLDFGVAIVVLLLCLQSMLSEFDILDEWVKYVEFGLLLDLLVDFDLVEFMIGWFVWINCEMIECVNCECQVRGVKVIFSYENLIDVYWFFNC